MSTLDIISLAIGVAGLLVPLIFSFIRYKIDYPELAFLRYGIFRGYKIKREVKSIVIIRNGSADYTKQIRGGFINRASEIFSRTEYALQFSDYEGYPYVHQDQDNHLLIRALMAKKPDVLVTIGTQISLSAVKHFNNQLPIIAIGLGAPIECGLIDPADNCSVGSGNYACVRYGLKLEERLKFMKVLFEKAKKSFVFYFLWNGQAPQDKLLAEEAARLAKSDTLGMDLRVLETTDEKLPPELDEHGNIFFGFYHLNRNLESYLRNTRKAVFFGLNPNDTRFGCIASTGNNDYHIGELAVDRLLVPHLVNRAYLSKLRLVEPKPYFTINREVAEQKNLRFTAKGKRLSSEVIDFNRAAWLQAHGSEHDEAARLK